MSARHAASRCLHGTFGVARPAPDIGDGASRIIMVDPAVVGQSHLLVNTGFIRLLLSRFDEVVVLAEETHRQALENYLAGEIDFGRIKFMSYTERRQMLGILRDEIARTNAQAVLLTNLHYGLFARLSVMPQTRRMMLYWVLHSHLASLARSGLKERVKNRLKISLLFDLFPASRFIVCGDSIRTGFLDRAGQRRYQRQISAVFHPVGISATVADHVVKPDGPARAGASLIYIQGWHRPTPDIRSALEQLAGIAQRRSMHLDVVWNDFSRNRKRKHFTKDYRDRIREIAAADFFLFLPADDYSLQASGALLDLVVAATPAIGIRTAFGAELAQIVGEFGFFFDTLDEIVQFVATADAGLLLSRRAEFRRNLRRGGAAIAQTNAAQLSRLGPAFAAPCIEDAPPQRLRVGT